MVKVCGQRQLQSNFNPPSSVKPSTHRSYWIHHSAFDAFHKPSTVTSRGHCLSRSSPPCTSPDLSNHALSRQGDSIYTNRARYPYMDSQTGWHHALQSTANSWTSSQYHESPEEGPPLDDLSGPITADSFRFAEQIYAGERSSLIRKMHAWCKHDMLSTHGFLKLVGIIFGPYCVGPTVDQIAAGAKDHWASFDYRYAQMKHKVQTKEEWKIVKDNIAELAQEVISRANIICATATIAATRLMKGKVFDILINDDTSVTTALKTLLFWKGTHETLVYIGGDVQLCPVVITGPEENPFCKLLGYSTFAPFRDMLLPSYLLNVRGRMTAGLAHMTSEIFYEGKILDGVKTHLKDCPLLPIPRQLGLHQSSQSPTPPSPCPSHLVRCLRHQ